MRAPRYCARKVFLTTFIWGTKGAKMSDKSSRRLGCRSALTGLAGASVALPYFWTRRAHAAQQLTVRTPGGAYDEVKGPTVYEPFRKATGIEIIPVPATVAKLLAMHRSGQMEVDLIDTGDDVLLQLDLAGPLPPAHLKGFKRKHPANIRASCKQKPSV